MQTMLYKYFENKKEKMKKTCSKIGNNERNY